MSKASTTVNPLVRRPRSRDRREQAHARQVQALRRALRDVERRRRELVAERAILNLKLGIVLGVAEFADHLVKMGLAPKEHTK